MVQNALRTALGTMCCVVLINSTYGQSAAVGEPRRPALSPYLNQLRGVNPAVNYYFGVASRNDRRPVQLGPPVGHVIEPGKNGHNVHFMNCAPYFQLNSGVRKR